MQKHERSARAEIAEDGSCEEQVLVPPDLDNDREAYEVLISLAHGKTWSIPHELLVRSIMEATAEFDWPVKRAALEALLRRMAVAKASHLRVARAGKASGTSSKQSVLGRYTLCNSGTGNKNQVRPYETVIHAISPLHGSCNCFDFLSNSLGLCKHLLVCFDHIFSSETRRRRALKEQSQKVCSAGGVVFSPFRPALGEGDILQQLRWQKGADYYSKAMPERIKKLIRKRFLKDDSEQLMLRETFADDAAKRLSLVNDVLELQGRPKVLSASGNGFEFDPAARALLFHEKERLNAIGKRFPPFAAVRKVLKSMHHSLYPYQIAGVEKFFQTGRLLLADEMGLGKTAQAIAVSHALVNLKLIKRGLVVVPAPLKEQWKREWESFTDTPIQVVDGAPEERMKIYERSRRGILLVHYEQLIRDLDDLLRWHPEFMIVDEAQRMKNWQTKTASSIKVFKPEFRLILTGTPMENRIEELASLVEWIEPFAIEPKWRLAPWYSEFGDGEGGSIVGARNLDTLRERLALCTLRRRRSEVLTELPKRTDTVVPIQMTEIQQSCHDEFTAPIARLVQAFKRRPMTPADFLRLMQMLTSQRIICDSLELYEFKKLWPELSQISKPSLEVILNLNSPKLKEFREIIDHVVIGQKRKVVVFSQWRQMLQLANWSVEGILADAGLRSVFFTGREAQPRRTQNLVEFHDDPTAAMLFCTDAGGVGLNLQKAANCCVILDLPWNPAVLEQRIGRIYRHGQRKPVDIYKLVCDSGIEARIEALVGSKKKVFDGIFDEGSDVVSFDSQGRFCDRLEKIIQPLVADIPNFETVREECDGQSESELGFNVGNLADGTFDPLDEQVGDEEVGEQSQRANEDVKPSGQRRLRSNTNELNKQISTKDEFEGQIGPIDNPASQKSLPDIFASVRMTRSPDGHLTINAPPEAADTMAMLFEAMAKLMRSAGVGVAE